MKKKIKSNQTLLSQMQDDARLVAVMYFVYLSSGGYYAPKHLATFEILSATNFSPSLHLSSR